MNIPFSKPTLGQEEIDAASGVLASGWVAAGKETAAFEEEFSTYISPDGVDKYYCIFTNSCTSALKIAYKITQEKGYSGICYPKNTFCATYSAAHEVNLETLPYGLNHGKHLSMVEQDLGRLLTPENYIVVSMHYGSDKSMRPCFIEDSAHRIEPSDPLVGKIRCYSFYATKNMTTGSGGMFVTNDKDIYERARLFWRDGLTTSTADRLNGTVGYRVEAMAGGYDGNDIAASIGRVQLKRLPEFTKRRNDIRDYYNSVIGQEWQGNHLYPFFVESEGQVYECITWLKDRGVQCSYHYPGTGWLGVSLPIYPLLTDSEVEYVGAQLREWRATH